MGNNRNRGGRRGPERNFQLEMPMQHTPPLEKVIEFPLFSRKFGPTVVLSDDRIIVVQRWKRGRIEEKRELTHARWMAVRDHLQKGSRGEFFKIQVMCECGDPAKEGDHARFQQIVTTENNIINEFS